MFLHSFIYNKVTNSMNSSTKKKIVTLSVFMCDAAFGSAAPPTPQEPPFLLYNAIEWVLLQKAIDDLLRDNRGDVGEPAALSASAASLGSAVRSASAKNA